jgi:cyclopropane fatty-acyl-phospholipid synthase-like methyltransferase
VIKRDEFDEVYTNTLDGIKWTEIFIQPKMAKEFENKIIQAGMDLLDIGSGCSFDSIYYAFHGINTTVLDFSKNAILKLNKLAEIYGIKISSKIMSVLDIYKDISMQGKFDVITDNGLFHHIEAIDRDEYVKSIYHSLKNKGLFYLRSHSEFNTDSTDNYLVAHRIKSDDIISLFFPYFKIIELSTFDVFVDTRNTTYKMWFLKLEKR